MKIKLTVNAPASPALAIAPTADSAAQAATASKFENREAWLHAATGLFRPIFASVGLSLPDVHESVGFGFATRGAAKRNIGQCWDKAASADGKAHVFVSPTIDDAGEALAILAHELIHATLGTKAGHGPAFRAAALSLGLTGPMRSTVAGDGMKKHAAGIIAALGNYPHARINLADRVKAGVPTQATRLLKFVCTSGNGYSVRITQKWIAAHGAPVSPVNGQPMVAA